MGSYFSHWLGMSQRAKAAPPIFIVNWFRKDENGKFIWPGYGQNMRVLKWMFERVDGQASGQKTVLGTMPRYEDLEWMGLDFTPQQYEKATSLDVSKWQTELNSHKDFFQGFAGRLPAEFSSFQQATAEKFGRGETAAYL